MAYRVEILPTAWEDLKRIEDWYLVQFGVETALKVREHMRPEGILPVPMKSNTDRFFWMEKPRRILTKQEKMLS